MLSDAEKLALALEAVELADGVMSYCAGDAWEREATASDRDRFDEIYAKLCPRPMVEPPAPIWPTKAWVRSKFGRVECAHCGKELSGEPNAIKQHCAQFHPGMPAQSRLTQQPTQPAEGE
jgi:hypothetical protein